MTQEQINELLAFAQSEIARHQKGLTIKGGNGAYISGTGPCQSVSIHTPRIIEEPPPPEQWTLYLFGKLSGHQTFTDDSGTHVSPLESPDWTVVGRVTRPYADLEVDTIFWQTTQFAYLPPDADDRNTLLREVRLQFSVRAFEPHVIKKYGPYNPPYEKGYYRIPVEITLEHLNITFGEEYKAVHTDKLQIRQEPVTYIPQRQKDRQWYELRLSAIKRIQ